MVVAPPRTWEVDPAEIDSAVLASLPDDVRAQVQRQIDLARAVSRRGPQRAAPPERRQAAGIQAFFPRASGPV